MSFTCDTSVLVAVLASWHPDHAATRRALEARSVTTVPAHVLLECYSVLTRLPRDRQVSPPIAAAAIAALDLVPLTVPGDDHRTLVGSLAERGIGGGSVYDGLIGATARHHGMTLLTLDVRARRTYDALGVAYEIVRVVS